MKTLSNKNALLIYNLTIVLKQGSSEINVRLNILQFNNVCGGFYNINERRIQCAFDFNNFGDEVLPEDHLLGLNWSLDELFCGNLLVAEVRRVSSAARPLYEGVSHLSGHAFVSHRLAIHQPGQGGHLEWSEPDKDIKKNGNAPEYPASSETFEPGSSRSSL